MSERRLRHGLLRLARAGFVALLTMTLSVGAHVHAGGQPPDAIGTAGLTGVFGVFCWALSARRWTARPLVAVFLLAQAATHVTAMAQHPMHDMSGAGAMGGASMALSHAVAAVLMVVMVTRGESALIGLLRHLTLRCLDLRAVPGPEHADAPVTTAAPSPLAHLFVPTVRGRAPPSWRVLPTI